MKPQTTKTIRRIQPSIPMQEMLAERARAEISNLDETLLMNNLTYAYNQGAITFPTIETILSEQK